MVCGGEEPERGNPAAVKDYLTNNNPRQPDPEAENIGDRREEMIIDGVKYVKKETDIPLKIVILQRGWVAVGYYRKEITECQLDHAHVIRVWGTTNGLGEIALNGPTTKTILDPCGKMQFHELTVVAMIDCVEGKWNLL